MNVILSGNTTFYDDTDEETNVHWSRVVNADPLNVVSIRSSTSNTSVHPKATTEDLFSLAINLSGLFLFNWLVIWSVKCQGNGDECQLMFKVMPTTKRSSVYSHRGVKKLENIYV